MFKDQKTLCWTYHFGILQHFRKVSIRHKNAALDVSSIVIEEKLRKVKATKSN